MAVLDTPDDAGTGGDNRVEQHLSAMVSLLQQIAHGQGAAQTAAASVGPFAAQIQPAASGAYSDVRQLHLSMSKLATTLHEVSRGGGLGGYATQQLGAAAAGGNVKAAAVELLFTVLPQMISGFAKTINTFQDPYMATGMKARNMAQDLPIIGNLVKSLLEFGDAVTGVTRRLVLAEVERDKLRVRTEGELRAAEFRLTRGLEMSYAANAAAVQRGLPTIRMPWIDRQRPGGDLAFQEAEKRLAYQTQIQDAQAAHEATVRNRQSAAVALGEAQDRVFFTDARRRQALGDVRSLQRALPTTGNPAALAEANNRYLEAVLRNVGAVQTHATALESNRQAAMRETEARVNLNRVQIEAARSEIEMLQTRRGVMQGFAGTLAGMNAIEREQMTMAFHAVVAAGGNMDILPPDIAQLGLRVPGAQALANRWAARQPEFSLLFQQGGELEGQQARTIEAQDRLIFEATNRLQEAMRQSATTASEQMADAVAMGFERALRTISLGVDNRLRELDLNRMWEANRRRQ